MKLAIRFAIAGVAFATAKGGGNLRGNTGFRSDRTNDAVEHNLQDFIQHVDETRNDRSLAMDHMMFHSLPCNDGLDTVTCEYWDDNILDSSEEVVIPCGECVKISCSQADLVLSKGLNILGRLVFPDYATECPNAQTPLTITTPHIFVQGELVMQASRPTSDTPDVKIIMTGTEDQLLTPHLENAMACSPSCNFEKKPIAIAGGKLNIQGLPQACTTWSFIKDQVIQTTPEQIPIPELDDPPASCSRTVINHDFETGDDMGWTEHYSPGGERVVTENGNSYYEVIGRTASWMGPMIELKDYLPCVQPGAKYYIKARAKLTSSKPDGLPPNCTVHGTDCLKLILYTEDRNSTDDSQKLKHWTRRADSNEGLISIEEGEWFDLYSEARTFTQEEVTSPDGFYQYARRLFFDGPEPDVDIAIDDFSLSLDPPPEVWYQPNQDVCQDLIPFNADMAVPYSISPYYKPQWDSKLSFLSETLIDGTNNTFYRVSNRNVYFGTLGSHLNTDCIKKGAVYQISVSLRVHSPTEPIPIKIMKYSQNDGQDEHWEVLKHCDAQTLNDGWVTCSTYHTFDDRDASATQWKLYHETPNDGTFFPDIDFDDIHVTFVHGPTTDLIVQDSGVDTCWGAGSELLITSNTLDYDDFQLATVNSVSDNSDGTYTISLQNPIARTSTQSDGTGDYPAEVALLSRNIIFEADSDDTEKPLHGGHLIVAHTSHAQLIEGIEVRKFGQQQNLGRYPIHFHMSGSVAGSKVSKNLIRQSFQRCVVIHGTHDLTVKDNIAFDTQGHCYMLEDGGEMNNVFEHNLGAYTQPAIKIRAEETDDTPSTFWITNPNNTVIRNVAAGSRHSGFWYEMRDFVRGPSQNLQPDLRPFEMPLKLFQDNVAHSNWEHGVKTYPGRGMNPPTQGLVTFTNTKSFRNKGVGVFFHNSKNLHIEGGLYADNRIQIDFDRVAGCTVNGAKAVGYSDEYRDVVTSNLASYHCPSTYPLIGVQMHTYWSGGSSNLGQDVTNVSFEKLGPESGCANSSAISVDYYEDKGYFDIRSSAAGLSFDAETNNDKINLCRSATEGIDHVAIRDVDGSDIGQPGFIVSDSPRMTTFWPENTCISSPLTCSASCPNICYRVMGMAVSNEIPDNVELNLKDVDSGKSISVLGSYDYPMIGMDSETLDVNEHTKSWRHRMFFAQLPAGGNYIAKFVLDGVDYWPRYVQHQYQDEPGPCGNEFNSFVFEIPSDQDCSQLITNGDMENGIVGWRNNDGGLQNVDETASGQGQALSNVYRYSEWHGIAQYLDTRCMVAGNKYTLTAKVKMYESDGFTAYSCSVGNGCPVAYVRSKKGVGNDEYDHTYTSVGSLQGQWQEGEWNEISGDFTITAAHQESGSVLLYFEGPPKNVLLILDDVSLVPKVESAVTCSGPVLDDKFDDGSFLGWTGNGSGGHELTNVNSHESGNNYFLVTGRNAVWKGPLKDIKSIVSCIVPGKIYTITAMVRLTSQKAGGVKSNCEIDGTNCVYLTFKTEDLDPNGGDNKKEWIGLGSSFTHNDGEWFEWSHDTMFSDYIANDVTAVERRMYFSGPENDVDIAIDNFKIELKGCNGPIIDDNFDDYGTFVGWNSHWSPGGPLITDVLSSGNKYFVAQGRSASWQGPMKELPLECLTAGAQYQITAKLLVFKPDGSKSNCETAGGWSPCVRLTLYTADYDLAGGDAIIKNWIGLGGAGQHNDGEWFNFTNTVTFSEAVVNQETAKLRRLYFEGPEEGVEIAMDDFKLFAV